MKKLSLVSLCLTLCVLFSACGASVSTMKDESAPMYAASDVYYSYASNASMDSAESSSVPAGISPIWQGSSYRCGLNSDWMDAAFSR